MSETRQRVSAPLSSTSPSAQRSLNSTPAPESGGSILDCWRDIPISPTTDQNKTPPNSSESWDASLNSPPPKPAHNYPNLSLGSREWL